MVDCKENWKFNLGAKGLRRQLMNIQTAFVTLHTLRSKYIFSMLFLVHILKYEQGEFVKQSRASLVGDHFLYSHDLHV